jgi:integrase
MGPGQGKRKEHRVSTGVPVTTDKPPREVVNVLRNYTSQIVTSTFVARGDKVVFEQLVELLKDDYTIHRRRSLDTALFHVAHLRPFFERVAPINYTPALIKAYQKHRLQEGAAVATVNREVACLAHMLMLAFESDMLPHPKKFKQLEGEKIREGFLAPADFYKILEELDGYRKDLAEFIYLSGWRSGRAKSLEWKQVDLRCDPAVIRLPDTSGTKRTGIELPLTGRLDAILEARHKARLLDCPYVFHDCGEKVGNLRKAWYSACVRAGYMKADHSKNERIYIHDFRRSLARNLAETGIDQKVIMDRAGWKTSSTFMRYRITSTDSQVKANEQLERYIRENQESKVIKIGEH